MAIYADCESKKRARKKYYEKEENREKKRVYMRKYYEKNKVMNEELQGKNAESFIDGAQ